MQDADETHQPSAAEREASPATRDAVWAWAQASRAHPVIDAGPYFELIREAMLAAQQRIMLIGWDFDTRIRFGSERGAGALSAKDRPPARLGPFMIWLAERNPGLEIRILKWNFGTLKAVFGRGRMVMDLIRWWRHPRIHFKLDSAHPLGCSHHQKIVVIDDKFAVCGGIDLTSDRWDTRDHLENDPRRIRPGGGLSLPWHDCTMLVEGDIAAKLGELGRLRWEQAGGEPMEPCRPQQGSAWPERLKPHFTDVTMGIARTRSPWRECSEVREVESLFLEQIARARRFVFAENQYFASRKVAEAIADRLEEPDPPEFLIIGPQSSDGWLQQQAMDTARVRLVEAVRARDHAARFSLWNPFTAAGTPIYVHSKLTIIDDEILRIGSANMNNRSMGLDSECDVFVDGTAPADEAVRARIRQTRIGLLAEHCGASPDEMAAELDRQPTMAAAVAALMEQRKARGTGRELRPLAMPELSTAEKLLADNEVLDPEHPEEMLSFYRKGLFGGRLRAGARRFKNKLRGHHES